ncbi:HAMP domain-containing histidine kinase [Ktedonobacteria bacterium brp13]|nr:HAMP domain-containing histidine kinase [Ktedonobacteria bacterium brp13]
MRKRTQKQTQTTDIDASNCSFHTQRSQVCTELVTHTSDLMIVLREDFRMVDVNLAASQSLELSTEEATGQTGLDCRTVLGCQNLNRMVLCGTSSCPLVRAQRQGSLPNEELILGIEPEHSYEVSASITPVTIDDTFYAIFTARDMSALKVINSVRSNFVSMISHELRTPLNSVHGFIDLLLQGHMGALTDEQHTYLGYTQEGVQQLIAIVEDILFMTRSDLGQFEVKQQEFHLLSLVRQVTRSLQPQAARAEVALCSTLNDDVPALSIDPQRIKQVLSNLIANAIKFTPPGGTVTVSSRRHDEHFEMISVEDTGYGIPPEDSQHVFERFYQSNHSQQSKMGGYGLGLAIAKLIVEQHGGTIGFDTVINKGTTFYFTVPLFIQGQPT